MRRVQRGMIGLLWMALGGQVLAQSGGICDSGQLMLALLLARPGATVRIGACHITAQYLYIKPGVTLEGQGFTTYLDVPANGIGVIMRGGKLANLQVVSEGRVGVVAIGASAELMST